MEKIYPRIPTAPPQDSLEANSYRIQKILDIQNYLEKNKEERRKTLKKYTRVLSAVNVTDGVLTTVAIGMGISGVSLLTTIIAAPIVLGLEISALGLSAGSIILKFIDKKLHHKADKHRQILILSESKLNTIYNHISKAIEDGNITEEEFKLILEEENKFKIMKEEIRQQHVKKHIEHADRDTKEIVQQMKNFLEDVEKSKSK